MDILTHETTVKGVKDKLQIVLINDLQLTFSFETAVNDPVDDQLKLTVQKSRSSVSSAIVEDCRVDP